MLRRLLMGNARNGQPGDPSRRPPRARTQRGQSLLEFALIAPVFMTTLFGAFDFGLWMFSVGSARFASADAAVTEAQVANSIGRGACDAKCTSMGIGQGTSNLDCDADCQARVAIASSSLKTSSFARVLEIDVIKEQKDTNSGALTDTTTMNKYDGRTMTLCSGPYTVSYPNGTSRTYCVAGNTAYSTRNAKYGQLDYLKLDIIYEYPWKTGFMSVIFPQPPELHAPYVVQLEPQTFP